MKNMYFDSNAHRISAPMNGGWTCSSYGNGSNGLCINNDTGLGFSYVCSGIGASQGKIWNQCKMDTPYLGSEKILGTTISYTDLTVPKPPFPIQSQTSFGFKPLGFTSSRSVVNESSRPEFNPPYFSTPTVGFPILGRGLVFSNQGGKSESERTTEFVSKFLETSKSRAQRLKDNAITKSDHLTADIFTEQAWADDAEWHREIAVKNNDHGEHGIEFRGKQLQGYYRNIARLLEELETEAQRIKDNAITSSDRLKADIITNEFLITMNEEIRVIALKKNDRGEQGVEFRSKKITECHQEIHRLTKALIGEADRIKGEAITPSDHLRADILVQEAWKTDAEWHRREAVKNNDHGEYGIEFRNKQLPEYDKEIYRLIKDFTKNNADVNLSGLNINDNVAKLLADSLSKGEMPNLKKLHLEGNNITDEGETALVKAMKGKAQDIIILTQRVDITKKMISGTKEEKIAIYKDLIEKGKAKGTYDEALVIDKSLWGEIKNSGKILKVVTNASIGFTKCHFAPEDIAVDYAQNKIMAKLPKMINGVLNYAAKLVDLENIFTCYVDASEDAWTSAVGQQAVKHELCVVGETEFCGE